MNKQLNQIQTIENLITNAKLSLKSWASQISQYHKKLKDLSQQLNEIKQQTTMNENKTNNLKGGTN